MNKISGIIGKCLTRIERWFGCNHLNPLLTLYVNLRLLPFAQAIKFPIYVYGWPHLMDLSGSVRFNTLPKRGSVRLNVVDLSPSPRGNGLDLCIRGRIIFGGTALVRSNTKIYVDRDATLSIGHNLRLGAGIIINCLNNISIGEGVRIGHNSQLLDSNMHFLLDLKRYRVASLKKSIVIGSHCWLTNSVSVYGGASIPPYSVVVSGTVVNKNLSDLGSDNILGGSPCRVLASGVRLVNNYEMERRIDTFYKNNPTADFPVQMPVNEEEWFINS